MNKVARVQGSLKFSEGSSKIYAHQLIHKQDLCGYIKKRENFIFIIQEGFI